MKICIVTETTAETWSERRQHDQFERLTSLWIIPVEVDEGHPCSRVVAAMGMACSEVLAMVMARHGQGYNSLNPGAPVSVDVAIWTLFWVRANALQAGEGL